jgi:N-acetylneuraminic acid mutarotase
MGEKKYGFAGCFARGFVYVFGGQMGKEGVVLSKCEKYDLDRDEWVEVGEMPRERTMAKVVLVGGSKILLIGGLDSLYQGVAEIDVFDVDSESFVTLDVRFPLAC